VKCAALDDGVCLFLGTNRINRAGLEMQSDFEDRIISVRNNDQQYFSFPDVQLHI
jgi:hypothetical protein